MELRTIALATTALVAIATFAQPVSAAGSSYMGKVNLGLGYAWEDWFDGNTELDYTTLHGSASVNVPYNDRVNFQFDIFGAESLDEYEDDDGSYYGGFGAGLHLNYRDPEVGALGVFGTVGRAAIGSTSAYDFVVFAGGIEGEYYCNAWTLSAQAGLFDSDASGYYMIQEAAFIRAGAAYYPSKRLKLAGNVGYLDGNTSNVVDPDDVTAWNWGLSIEYLFGQSVPVSTYLDYRGQSMEAYDGADQHDRHEVRAGVRFHFGVTDDLQKADRQGAGFESPDILTWGRFD
jgi:hypothetical protein